MNYAELLQRRAPAFRAAMALSWDTVEQALRMRRNARRIQAALDDFVAVRNKIVEEKDNIAERATELLKQEVTIEGIEKFTMGELAAAKGVLQDDGSRSSTLSGDHIAALEDWLLV